MYYNTEAQIIATICNKYYKYFNSVNRIYSYLHLV